MSTRTEPQLLAGETEEHSSNTKLAWISERLNPVLVKEVRQALRGASFRNVYLVTLILIGVAGTAVLLNQSQSGSEPGGLIYGQTVFGCLCVGLIGLVPLVAFQSVSSEWEENTYDLLVLTHLSPFQVVLGKLLSCAVQMLLILSAFAPVLAVGLVLPGLDPVVVLALSAYLPIVSLGLCCISMAIAAHCRVRLIRVMAMGIVAMGLAMMTMGMVGFTGTMLSQPDEIQRLEFLGVIGLLSLGGLTISALAFCSAMVRFTHEEEDASTAPRVVLYVAGLLTVVGCVALNASVSGFGAAESTATVTAFFLFSYPALLAFGTEPNRLGRRTALQLRGKRWLPLRLPFLPGADRGVLYIIFLGMSMAGLMWGGSILTGASSSGSIGGLLSSRGSVFNSMIGIVGSIAYLLIYIGLPSMVLRRFCRTAQGRWRVRLISITLLLAGIMLPMAFGLFTGARSLGMGEHPGNPFWTLGRLFGTGDVEAALLVAMLGGAVVGALYLVLLPRALGELRTAARGEAGKQSPGRVAGAKA